MGGAAKSPSMISITVEIPASTRSTSLQVPSHLLVSPSPALLPQVNILASLAIFVEIFPNQNKRMPVACNVQVADFLSGQAYTARPLKPKRLEALTR